jgi:hypothetical protein
VTAHVDTAHKPVLPLEYADERTVRSDVRRMAVLFGLVYFAQGICQVVLLLSQPIKRYLRDSAGYTADQIAHFFVIVMIPWMIKPVYGLLSDFVPIGGYRRKSYLLLMNLAAAGAFALATGVRDPQRLMVLMFVTAVGVACSDVVIDALMVETGQRTGRVKLFQGIQWTCISLSGIASAFAGGQLSERLAPARAVQVAAGICAAVAATVGVVAWLVVREPKSRMNAEQLKGTAAGIWASLRSKRLWLILLYLILAHYNPGMETPLYMHITKGMGLSEATYGMAYTLESTGRLVGAVLFTAVVAPRFSTRGSIVIGMLAIAAGMLTFLLARDKTSAYAASFCYGTGYMLNALALLSLAAETCPKRAEGFTFAAIMSVLNFAMQFADYSGSLMYERVFHRQFWPLPIIAASATMVAIALVPLLPKQPRSGDRT